MILYYQISTSCLRQDIDPIFTISQIFLNLRSTRAGPLRTAEREAHLATLSSNMHVARRDHVERVPHHVRVITISQQRKPALWRHGAECGLRDVPRLGRDGYREEPPPCRARGGRGGRSGHRGWQRRVEWSLFWNFVISAPCSSASRGVTFQR